MNLDKNRVKPGHIQPSQFVFYPTGGEPVSDRRAHKDYLRPQFIVVVKSMTSKVRVTNACSKTADGFGCVAMKPDEKWTPIVPLVGEVKFLRCSVARSCCGGCPESLLLSSRWGYSDKYSADENEDYIIIDVRYYAAKPCGFAASMWYQ